MNLSLRPDWPNIVKRAWSVRLMALSALLSGVGAGLALAQPYLGTNPLLIATVVGLITATVSIIAIYARVVKQKDVC